MRISMLWSTAVVVLILLMTLAGCGSVDPTAAPQSTTAAEPVAGQQPTQAVEPTSDNAMQSPLPTPSTMESPLPTPPAGDVQTLRLALLPVMDVLPFHVAEQNGYFAQVGVQVESIPVKSGQERDTLMQTGQVDGMLTDLISPVLFNQTEAQVKVVRTARKAYPDSAMFRLLAAPGSKIVSPEGLAGVPIGSAQNTVIEYLTHRLLQRAGLTTEQIVTEEVGAIPVRFELLLNRQLDAATLPDPLASGAMAEGAVLIIDDTSAPELSQSILVFSTDSLETKPEAVRRFLQAWEMAAKEINANPAQYRNLLIEKGRVPPSIQGSFEMPPFPEASVPSPEQLADVVSWALENGSIKNDVPYERMVDSSFLP